MPVLQVENPLTNSKFGRSDSARRALIWAGWVLWWALAACATTPPVSELGMRSKYPVHRVAEGETVYSIARRYKVGVDELVKLNNLARPNKIFVGQSLLIPRALSPVAASTSVGKPKPTAVAPSCSKAKAAPRTGSGAGLLFPPVKGAVREPPSLGTEVNIASKTGAPVWAAAAGQVVFADSQSGYGQMVAIRHEKLKKMTIYAQNQALCVRAGQTVKRGQVIALVGVSSTLLFELRKATDPVPSARPKKPRRSLR